MNERIKICFAGLYEDTNLGDPIIAKCAETLFVDALGKDACDIDRVTINHFCFHPASPMVYRMMALTRRMPVFTHKFVRRAIRNEYVDFFQKRIGHVDAVVVVGGGLIEFTGGRFADGLYAIARCGVKHGFGVYLNAVGVEGYDDKNYWCRLLKTMLHEPSIKHVSTRDDYDTLVEKYFDSTPTIDCELVADSAVWAAEVYGKTKKNDSKVVGVGVVRKNIFEQYGQNFTPKQLKELYTGLVKELLSRGHEVEIFTNGSLDDNEFADEIYNELCLAGCEVKIALPASADELVNVISQYKVVIAGRLHSCIISYSLDIPAIGLVWNDKLKRFGRAIAKEDWFITPSADLIISQLADKLENAIKEGYDEESRKEYRQTILHSISKCSALIKNKAL